MYLHLYNTLLPNHRQSNLPMFLIYFDYICKWHIFDNSCMKTIEVHLFPDNSHAQNQNKLTIILVIDGWALQGDQFGDQ